mgnify:CR=1 FL=1
MFRNSPKLILKIDLDGDKGLNMSIILLDKYYSDHYTKTNQFFSKVSFNIIRGEKFTLWKSTSMTLPRNFQIGAKNSAKISFGSDKERYNYLKILKNSLIEWSQSEFWEGFNEPEKVRLNFSTRVWVLF